MDFQEQLSKELFTLGGIVVNLGQVIQIVLIVGLLLLLGYLLRHKWLPTFYAREDTATDLRPRSNRVIFWTVVTLSLITVLRTLGIDYPILQLDNPRTGQSGWIVIRISNIVTALLVFALARLVNWLIEEFLTQYYFQRQLKEDNKPAETAYLKRFAAARPVIYTIAAIIIAINIEADQITITQTNVLDRPLTVGSMLWGLLAFFMARFVLLALTRLVLSRYYQQSEVDEGSQYALNRLLTYLVYFIGVILMLETAGFKLIALWTGAAALLVGVGIGLQQTFNDLICGVIILFERSVKKGDIVDMGGADKVGTVKRIGARTSEVETRDGILMYVPNSKLIGERVVNWSQTERKARFHVAVGVAYGSDTELVKKILLEAAQKHPRIMKLPSPTVRFADFGNSSLDFELLFWARDFLRIEDVKSDLRFTIDQQFREKGIEIPFPQRDLWIRNEQLLGNKSGEA